MGAIVLLVAGGGAATELGRARVDIETVQASEHYETIQTLLEWAENNWDLDEDAEKRPDSRRKRFQDHKKQMIEAYRLLEKGLTAEDIKERWAEDERKQFPNQL